MSFKIFETGIYDYTDDVELGLNKPVLYTPQFFEKMLNDIGNVPLDNGHKGDAVGVLENIHFKDNCVYCDVDTKQDFKGISPVFSFDTVDRGTYLEAVDGEFVRAGITDTPRTHITYNSNKGNEGEKMVSEEAFEQMTKQNRKLERELASKDNLINANKEKLERYDELEKKVKELTSERDKANSELEKVKPLAEKYTAYENTVKTQLIDDIAGDDDSFKEELKDLTIDKLKLWKEKRTVNEEPTGVPQNVGEGSNENNGDNGDEYTYENFKEEYKKVTGEDPVFS